MRINWQLVLLVGVILIFMIFLAAGPHFGTSYRLPGRGGLGMH